MTSPVPCAALLMACSPIFLYQSVQPIGGVPAAALWLAALVAVAAVNRRATSGAKRGRSSRDVCIGTGC